MFLVKILRHPCPWQLDRVRSILSIPHGVIGCFSRTRTHFQPRLTSSSSASAKQSNSLFWPYFVCKSDQCMNPQISPRSKLFVAPLALFLTTALPHAPARIFVVPRISGAFVAQM